MLALGVFGLCQIHAFVDYLRANMTRDNFNLLFKSLVIGIASIICLGLAVLTLSGKVAPWTGRFYSLLDPSYPKNNILIILYGIFAVYFAGVMVRLMLVLAPVMCIM